MPKITPLQGLKPYNIAVDAATNTAEITMYGEVVEKRPTNWWTGRPIDGNFIVLNDFLDDLEALATCSNINVRINSVGGDMNAGVVICNRLRELSAHITTINDGLAASAASLIFMAGDTRKIYPGSIVMIHGAAVLLWDYYQEQDVQKVAGMLRAYNQSGINIYVERTGMDEAEIRQMVEAETWMTGQEAVDKGFATEVISEAEGEEPITMKLSPDRTRMMFGGRAVAACLFGKIPDSIQQMTEAEYAAFAADTRETAPAMTGGNNNSENGGNASMEIKNVDELRNAFPEFVQQIENSARAAGATAERQRIQGIESIENAVGDAEMIHNAKYGEQPMNAQELAFAAMQKQAKIGANMMAGMEADAAASGAANVTAAPAAGKEEPTDGPKAMAAQAAKDVAMFNDMKTKEVF